MPIVKGLRRFRSNIVSFRQVVTETSSLVPGSDVQQSRWSSGAPLTPKKKRITNADRRALLESFVNKYRAMNSGKFPTTTSAQKEVGGSYYTIRKMIQEMEYNVKISSVEEVPPVKETIKKTKGEDTVSKKIAVESSSRGQKVSNSQITMDQNLYEDAWLESADNSDKISKGKEGGIQPSTSSEETGNSNITKDGTGNIATKTHDTRDQCHEKLENHVKDEAHLDDKNGFESIDSKVEQQHDGNIIRDMPENQKDVALMEKASSSSLWGNLKSLASGFINIWKKQ